MYDLKLKENVPSFLINIDKITIKDIKKGWFFEKRLTNKMVYENVVCADECK